MGACASSEDATRRDAYQDVKVLGEGASCSVKQVKNKKNGTEFALKEMDKDSKMAESVDVGSLWSTECGILKELKHPNILQYVDSFSDNSKYYILTGLCKGGELFDYINKDHFSEAQASFLVRQMLLALKECHSKNIVHRDLKPENFVFEAPDVKSPLKLIDFGCATIATDTSIVQDSAGSPYYVAPEVLDQDYVRTGKVWRASDMWSIGIIIYLLVHGYPPFNGGSSDIIFGRIKMGKYRFSRKIKLSDDVKDLIRKLLLRDPVKRLTAEQALQHPWIARPDTVPTSLLGADVVASLRAFHQQSKLQKAVGKLLAGNFSAADKKAIGAVFQKYDVNGDGKLSASEIKAMMADLGKPPAEAVRLMEQFDDDHSGFIEQNEFANIQGAAAVSDEKKAAAMFKTFDANNDGAVSMDEIQKKLNMDQDAIKDMFGEVDKNGDGEISLEEWIEAMAARHN